MTERPMPAFLQRLANSRRRATTCFFWLRDRMSSAQQPYSAHISPRIMYARSYRLVTRQAD